MGQHQVPFESYMENRGCFGILCFEILLMLTWPKAKCQLQ
jgi:hypothetical protein